MFGTDDKINPMLANLWYDF